MKHNTLISTITLGLAYAFSGGVLASPATLHTFAEGQITSETNSKLNGSRYITPIEVSNNGVVFFTSTTPYYTSVWRMDQGDTVYPLGAGLPRGITVDGDYVYSGRLYRWQDNNYQLDPNNVSVISARMSSDGRTFAGADSGAGLLSTIASYPNYRTVGGTRFTFEFSQPSFTRPSSSLLTVYPEQTSKGLYEDVQIVDIDGTGEIFLTSAGFFYGGYSKHDLTLMDRSGRYRSAPLSVFYGKVALSNNADVIMARRYEEQCPDFSTTVSGVCAVIWVKDQGVFPIGNFYPEALAGDGRTVLGSTLSTDDTPSIPIIWDDVQGMRPFVSAMNDDYGIDLSGWSDLHPLAISKDSSRIAGHGINPDGNREGFLITRPEKAATYWVMQSELATQLTRDENWQSLMDGGLESTAIGATATLTFEGTRVRYYGSKGKDKGQVDVYIDNTFWKAIDLYQCTQDDYQLLFESDYLGEGEHTLKLIANGLKNRSSQGIKVSINAIEVETLPPLPFEPFAHVARDFPSSVWEIYDFESRLNGENGFLKPAYNATEQKPFSQVMNLDGSFTVESWFRPFNKGSVGSYALETKSVIADISYQGKYLSIYQKQGNQLGWTGQLDDGSVVAYLKEAKNEWDHVVVSGNWLQGSASIYLNNELVGDVTLKPDERASEDLIRVGEPMGFAGSSTSMFGISRLWGETAKFATYPETMTSANINALYHWPTRYGLEFAPVGSPEFSTRLPRCSLGCEPGLTVTNYVELLNGVNGGIGGIGGVGGF